MCLTRVSLGVVALAAAVGLAGPAAAILGAQANPRERVLYVSVLDRDGRPVLDLAPTDFIVREDGVRREVLRIAPATEPMDVAVLVDDSQAASGAMQDIRLGLTAFVEDMAGPHRVALIGVGDRPTILAEYTTDRERLKTAINRLFPRPGSGAYLLEAIVETSRGLMRRSPERPVMIAVSTEGQEFSERDHTFVIDQLAASGAAFHALVLVDPRAASDLTDWARERNLVFDRGTRATGGRRDNLLTSMALQDRLLEVAAELQNQYRVVYFRPEALIPPEQVEVDVDGRNLVVRGTPARSRGV